MFVVSKMVVWGLGHMQLDLLHAACLEGLMRTAYMALNLLSVLSLILLPDNPS